MKHAIEIRVEHTKLLFDFATEDIGAKQVDRKLVVVNRKHVMVI